MTLLIHPGFHKTATTWLQETVFSDQRFFRSLFSHAEVSDLFVAPHDFAFDAARARDAVARKLAGSQGGITDVISSEILSANIITGSRDSLIIADRIATIGQPAKVLFTVRSQQRIAQSIYMQYLKRGGRLSIGDYLTFAPEPGYFWFDPGSLEFDRLVQAYADRFGADNVMVLPQELLARDQAAYLRLLFGFAGLDEAMAESELQVASARGVSPPASGVPILRLANAFRNTQLNPGPDSVLSWGGEVLQALGYRWRLGKDSADAKMKATVKTILKGRYGASNARLQAFAPVDLAALGYEMPG